jgi:nucleotide-binding universal stress UspA family protein
MKNILLLTDFSDTSKNAINYALQLFEKELCQFYVLYVQDSSVYTTDDLMTNSSSSLYSSLIDKPEKKLLKYIAKLESEFANDNFDFHSIVDFDSFIDATKQTMESKKINLIVMGTNGATGAKEVIFGSNTINVIRKINCTTLIIPETSTYVAPKEILLALDPFDTLNGKAIRNFFNFFNHHNLKLHVLRIHPDNDGIEDEDKSNLTHYMKSETYTYDIIYDVPMEHAVDTYLQTKKIDILSLFVQEETLLERLFIGSPTTKINKEARFPLLIFHT